MWHEQAIIKQCIVYPPIDSKSEEESKIMQPLSVWLAKSVGFKRTDIITFG